MAPVPRLSALAILAVAVATCGRSPALEKAARDCQAARGSCENELKECQAERFKDIETVANHLRELAGTVQATDGSFVPPVEFTSARSALKTGPVLTSFWTTMKRFATTTESAGCRDAISGRTGMVSRSDARVVASAQRR